MLAPAEIYRIAHYAEAWTSARADGCRVHLRPSRDPGQLVLVVHRGGDARTLTVDDPAIGYRDLCRRLDGVAGRLNEGMP